MRRQGGRLCPRRTRGRGARASTRPARARAAVRGGARRRAMPKQGRVTLGTDDRADLEGLLARGKADVRRLKHAQILLKADEADDGPAWSDKRIADALHAGTATVERVRQRVAEEGPRRALRAARAGTRE